MLSRKYPQLNDEKWLRQKYEVECLGTRAIGVLAGVKTPNSVRQALIRFGIPVRTISDGITCKQNDGFIPSWNVLHGCLLGDGCLQAWNKRSDYSYPSFHKKNKYYDHISYVAQILFGNKWKDAISEGGNACNGKWCTYFCLRSLAHKELMPLYRKWYSPENDYKKVVPVDLELNKEMVLHWFLDDGSTSYRRKESKTKQVRGVFCSESFSKNDQETLCEKMNGLGIRCSIRPYGEGTGWRIHIKQKCVADFLDFIGPSPVSSLAYKWK